MPLRGKVLIRRWSCPLSPIALRAALIRVVSADSRQSAQASSRRLARPGLQRVPVTDQVGQDVEDLRLNRDQCAPPCRKSDPDVLAVETAKNRPRKNPADGMN